MPHVYTEDQLVEQLAIGLFAELGQKFCRLKWTPMFGPRNAEIKLGFQGLLGLGFCCFISLRSHSSNASERSASSPKGATRRGDRRAGRRCRFGPYFHRHGAGLAPYDSGE